MRVEHKGRVDYHLCWQAMREFTDSRPPEAEDQIWVVSHPAVFTLGQAGDPAHVLDAGDTPVVQSDRGGQVTWHGPGQAVFYVMIDLRRAGLGIRTLVERLERAVIGVLADYGIKAQARRDAPGVYVDGAKIAALGLRVRRGCSYHGLAVNLDPDLSAFDRINPCGYEGLAVTSFARLGVEASEADLIDILLRALERELTAG